MVILVHPLTSRGQKFTEGDAFIGYQKDTPAAVVFQATHQLIGEGPVVSSREWRRMEQASVSGPKVEEEEEKKDSDVWKKSVCSLIVLLAFLYETGMVSFIPKPA